MLVLVKVTHVTFLVNGRDGVPCLLLALASKRCERAEASSTCVTYSFLSCRVENPSARVARVVTAVHNLRLTHSSFIPARCVVNSAGDTEDGGRLSCVLGEQSRL